MFLNRFYVNKDWKYEKIYEIDFLAKLFVEWFQYRQQIIYFT